MAYDIFLASYGFLYTRLLNIQMILYIIFLEKTVQKLLKKW